MTIATFLATRRNFIAFIATATSHLDKTCGSLDTCVVVIIFGIAAFHAAFTVEDCDGSVRRDLVGANAIPVAAVVEERRKNAFVLNHHLFGFKTAHGVARCAHRIHVELVVQRVILVLVLLVKPVESLNAFISIARRLRNGNHDKAMGGQAANDGAIFLGIGSATGAPHHDGMFLGFGQLLGISENLA